MMASVEISTPNNGIYNIVLTDSDNNISTHRLVKIID